MTANANSMQTRRNELLTDVAEHTAGLVRDYGLPEDVAMQIGGAVADALAAHWGGQIITIPKDYHYRLAQRDRAILEEHRSGGISYSALAKRYNISERGIRMLLRRAELRDRSDRNLRQLSLFGEG